MSTALDTELAVEYLMSKETVTNTRLSSLGALHRAVEAGSMPTGARRKTGRRNHGPRPGIPTQTHREWPVRRR